MMRLLLILIFLITCAIEPLMAQLPHVEFPGRPRYPDGKLFLRGGAGMTKYTGEFEGGDIGKTIAISAAYAILPEFALGIGVEIGDLSYERRQKLHLWDTYRYQFELTDPVHRNTSYSAYHIE
jgi:hypothetical protein